MANKRTIASYPAKRIVQQIGGLTKKNRGHLNAEARSLATEIKRSGRVPHKTGRLEGSVEVAFVGGQDPRFDVKSVDYGDYQNNGTRYIAPVKFTDVIKEQRQSWEAEVRRRAKGGR